MPNVTLRKATADDSEFVFLVKKAALGEYIEQTWGWDEDFQRRFHNDYTRRAALTRDGCLVARVFFRFCTPSRRDSCIFRHSVEHGDG